jgi:hypothetical protein
VGTDPMWTFSRLTAISGMTVFDRDVRPIGGMVGYIEWRTI